jgi:hypothetical protein
MLAKIERWKIGSKARSCIRCWQLIRQKGKAGDFQSIILSGGQFYNIVATKCSPNFALQYIK